MTRQTASRLTTFFGTAFLVGVVLQLIALGLMFGLEEVARDIHTELFQLTSAQFDLAIYATFALMKLIGIMLFLVPWITLKIMLSNWTQELD